MACDSNEEAEAVTGGLSGAPPVLSSSCLGLSANSGAFTGDIRGMGSDWVSNAFTTTLGCRGRQVNDDYTPSPLLGGGSSDARKGLAGGDICRDTGALADLLCVGKRLVFSAVKSKFWQSLLTETKTFTGEPEFQLNVSLLCIVMFAPQTCFRFAGATRHPSYHNQSPPSFKCPKCNNEGNMRLVALVDVLTTFGVLYLTCVLCIEPDAAGCAVLIWSMLVGGREFARI